MNSRAKQLANLGDAARKGGDKAEAIFYYEWALRSHPPDFVAIQAWKGMSKLAESPKKREEYLVEILGIDPFHVWARRELTLLKNGLSQEAIYDPNQPINSYSEKQAPAESKTQQTSCPRCSARMVYSPDGSQLACEHCGQGENLAERDYAGIVQGESEQNFLLALASAKGHLPPQNSQTFDCQACGHRFLVDAAVLSVICPYCDHVYVVEEINFETRELIPPQAIIPFQISLTQARRILHDWFRTREVAASAEPHGYYLPAFTFDIGGKLSSSTSGPKPALESYWDFLSQKSGQTSVSIANKDSLPQSVSAPYSKPKFELESYWNFLTQFAQPTPAPTHDTQRFIHFDDILIFASDKSSAMLANAEDWFDLADLLPYDPRYLAGFPAEIYDIPVSDASLQARRVAWERIKAGRRNSAASLSSAGMLVESYKLVLLPLWLAHYELDGIQYELAINGQTGKLKGGLPAR